MTVISEFISDVKFMVGFKKKYSKMQKSRDLLAPKVGDIAVDFTLSNIEGSEAITLSNFRGKKAVALIFGSFT